MYCISHFLLAAKWLVKQPMPPWHKLYVPVKLRLKHPPPGHTPGTWLCIVPRKGGNLNIALEGWGIWTGFISCSGVILLWVFWFLQGLTDWQDGISPLLVNNSFKRVFKRILKVSSRHIPLWKVWTAFDWRENLSLRRSISELVGGAFERLFCPKGWEFEQANLQKFKCLGSGCWSFDLTGTLLCFASNHTYCGSTQ